MYYDFRFCLAREMDEMHDVTQYPGQYLPIVLGDDPKYMNNKIILHACSVYKSKFCLLPPLSYPDRAVLMFNRPIDHITRMVSG